MCSPGGVGSVFAPRRGWSSASTAEIDSIACAGAKRAPIAAEVEPAGHRADSAQRDSRAGGWWRPSIRRSPRLRAAGSGSARFPQPTRAGVPMSPQAASRAVVATRHVSQTDQRGLRSRPCASGMAATRTVCGPFLREPAHRIGTEQGRSRPRSARTEGQRRNVGARDSASRNGRR